MALMLRFGKTLWQPLRRHPWAVVLVLLLVPAAAVAGVQLWATYHFHQAQQALAELREAEARRHVQACLRVWPRGKETLLLAARIEREAENLPEAARYLTEYARLHGPTEATQLEWVLLRAQGGEVEEVEEGLWKCVQEDHPATNQIFEALARGYLSHSRLSAAKLCLDRWIEREPTAVRAWVLRAEVFERLGGVEPAVADLKRAQELAPDHPGIRLALVNLYLSRHQLTEAVALVRHLVRLEPDNLAVLVALAQCHIEGGLEDQAREVLEKVLRQDPNNIPALLLLGQVASGQEHPDEAEGYFRRAMALKPHDLEVLLHLSRCLQQRGRHREAKELRDKYEAGVAARVRLGELQRGSLDRMPSDPAVLSEVGKLLLQLGQDNGALHWLFRALKEDPEHKPTHEILQRYYTEKGDFDKAAEHNRVLVRLGQQAAPPTGP
jgi:Tfp pilus assembly protein PilF